MAELIIILLGLVITGIMAAAKALFVIAAMSWFWVWVPFFIGVFIAIGVWLPDFDISS